MRWTNKTPKIQEMVDAMNKVTILDVELTIEERNLLSVGYKNVVGSRRASWGILSSIEQEEEFRGNEVNVKRIKEHRQMVETEMTDLCGDIMVVIDERLISSSSTGESTIFYYKMYFEFQFTPISEVDDDEDYHETPNLKITEAAEKVSLLEETQNLRITSTACAYPSKKALETSLLGVSHLGLLGIYFAFRWQVSLLEETRRSS